MITTDRLFLRPYIVEDSEDFFKSLQNNEEHLSDYFFNLTKIKDHVLLKEYFFQKTKDWDDNKGYACGIFLKNKLELIGHISVREIDWRVPKGEVAYFIFKSHIGRGYSAEALAAYRDWCFKEKKVNRLFLKTAETNIASIKIAEKSGFKFEGLLKKDYKKRERYLIDIKLYAYTENMVLIRTDSTSLDFRTLVNFLNIELTSTYGHKQSFFDKFNKIDNLKQVVVAYVDDIPAGCGAIKVYDDSTVEVKRMFVKESFRGKGIAGSILDELEKWAKELEFANAVLETGESQPEAIGLYSKKGYFITENYGQYIGVNNSVCFKKRL